MTLFMDLNLLVSFIIVERSFLHAREYYEKKN